MIFDLPDVTKCLTVCYLCNAIIQYSTTRDQMYHQNDGCFINLTSDFKIRFINDKRNHPLNDPGALGNQFMQISHHTARNQSIFAFGLHSPCLMFFKFPKEMFTLCNNSETRFIKSLIGRCEYWLSVGQQTLKEYMWFARFSNDDTQIQRCRRRIYLEIMKSSFYLQTTVMA